MSVLKSCTFAAAVGDSFSTSLFRPVSIVHVRYLWLHHMLGNFHMYFLLYFLLNFYFIVFLSHNFVFILLAANNPLIQIILYHSILVLCCWFIQHILKMKMCCIHTPAPNRCSYSYHCRKYLVIPSLPISRDRQGTE